MSDVTKRRDLDAAKLAGVKDSHDRMALRLQEAFGLRREEAIKFAPVRDDRGDRIRLKGATTKAAAHETCRLLTGFRPRYVRLRLNREMRPLRRVS